MTKRVNTPCYRPFCAFSCRYDQKKNIKVLDFKISFKNDLLDLIKMRV